MEQYRNFRDYHIEKLRDPEDARIFISIALEEYEEDDDMEAFLLALKDVIEAQGGITKLAKHAKLNEQNINDIFSNKVSLKFDDLEAILQGLGFRLSVEAVKTDESIMENEQVEILK